MKKLLNKVKAIFIAFKTKRVFYTIYFNFKYLPIHQAKLLPIIFYKHAYATISNGGKIILSDEMVARKCKVHIGMHALDFEYQCEKTHLNVSYGTLFINGKLEFRRGCIIDIKGTMECGNDVLFGPRCRIRVHNKAFLGDCIRIAHETQLFDSNFHFSEKVDEPGFYPISKPITIGSYCWVGNRSTLSPGVVLPDYTTVASNSLVNKNFSSLAKYSTIGGVPAKFLREGYTRVWDTNRELEYHKREFSWLR